MGGVVSAVASIVVGPICNALQTAFRGVIDFFCNAPRRICDVVFSQPQVEFSSEQDQAKTRELIDEQRRKKEGNRRKMTCKSCNINLVAYTFDCGDMACTNCNESKCATRCFECNEVIRQRVFMEYDRSALY